MRFLLLSIEFNAGTFSGNGVYACSQARALSQLGHQVLVVAGAPPGHSSGSSKAVSSGGGAGEQRVLHINLPDWGRLDASCCWREYAAGTHAVAAEVAAFGATAVLGVDWHSVGAYDALTAALPSGTLPSFVYLNYRVYHRTATPQELEVIEAQEREALRLSCCTLVLSRSDAKYLRRHFPAAAFGGAPLHVLLPALRSDMEALPPPGHLRGGEEAAVAAWAAPRRHLACCVRVSTEKEGHRFVELLEELQARGSLERLGVVPAMCGAGWFSPYGANLRARLTQHVPQCVVHDTFMGPTELAALYSSTLLNLHPPMCASDGDELCCAGEANRYDAYGMTIIEAASQGAPSLVQEGGHVGATDLLSSDEGEVFQCKMEQPTSKLADLVEQLLADPAALAATGQRAMAKARSWREHDNARALVRYVQEALVGRSGTALVAAAVPGRSGSTGQAALKVAA